MYHLKFFKANHFPRLHGYIKLPPALGWLIPCILHGMSISHIMTRHQYCMKSKCLPKQWTFHNLAPNSLSSSLVNCSRTTRMKWAKLRENKTYLVLKVGSFRSFTPHSVGLHSSSFFTCNFRSSDKVLFAMQFHREQLDLAKLERLVKAFKTSRLCTEEWARIYRTYHSGWWFWRSSWTTSSLELIAKSCRDQLVEDEDRIRSVLISV